jgi:hypothetical protein
MTRLLASALLSLLLLPGASDAQCVAYSLQGPSSLRLNDASGPVEADYVAALDIDGDGDDDLLLTHLLSGSANAIAWNLGDGSFRVQQTNDSRMNGPVQAIDVDGDGLKEIISDERTSIYVLKPHADGSFSELARIAAASGATAARLQRNGPIEIVTTVDSKVQIFNLASLSEPRTEASLPSSIRYELAAADMNEDGIDDIIVVANGLLSGMLHDYIDPSRESSITVFLSDGSHLEQGVRWLDRPQNAMRSVAIGDFNGDSHVDVATVSSDVVAVLEGDGRGNVMESQFVAFNRNVSSPAFISAANLNGDRFDDLVGAGGFTLSILLGSADGLTVSGTYDSLPSTGVALVRPHRRSVASIVLAQWGSDTQVYEPRCQNRLRAIRR